MPTFSKEFLEEFIDIFKDHPALWNTKSVEYKNGNLRNKGWKALLNKYKEIDKTANVEAAKRKINVLRASYRRELNKIIESRRNGSGSDDKYIPSLWYFDSLDFLRDLTFQKEPKRSFEDSLEMQKVQTLMGEQNDDSFDNFIVTQKEPTEEQCTSIFDDSFDEEKLCSCNDHRAVEDFFQPKKTKDCENLRQQSVKDEADVFAEGWAIIYRRLNADQKIFVRRIIDETLMLGQFGQLTYGSTKCLDSVVPINLQAVIHETPPPPTDPSSTMLTGNDVQIFSPTSTLLSQ